MAEVLLFHHALGQTPGFLAFADDLRSVGHVVHTPDLYAGRTFATVAEGVEHARNLGFGNIIEAGVASAVDLPSALVYAGFSLGVLATQMLAQTRPGALGALLLEACVPPSEFGGSWPSTVPVQIHGMQNDPSFAEDGDLDAARALVAEVGETGRAELFLYRGDQHLFTDRSLLSYRAEPAALLMHRVLAFLDDLS